MFIAIFPDRPSIVTWFAFQDPNGRCPLRDFLAELQAKKEMQWRKLVGRMQAFADIGWVAHTNFMKQLDSKSRHTIYEIKSHQERVPFVRCGNDAVGLDGFSKKDDWSKKDARALASVEKLADAAMAECKGQRR